MLDMYSIHSIDVVSIGRKRDQKGSKGGEYILFRRYQYNILLFVRLRLGST